VTPLLRESPEAVASMFVDRAVLEEAADSKPVILCPQGHPAWKEACKGFFGPRVSFVSSPRAAVRALGALCRYARWRNVRSAGNGSGEEYR